MRCKLIIDGFSFHLNNVINHYHHSDDSQLYVINYKAEGVIKTMIFNIAKLSYMAFDPGLTQEEEGDDYED